MSVLVAEDQAFIALDLSLAVEDAGGQVVGPVSSSREGLTLLAKGGVGAAILDLNLVDGESTALVEVLVGLGVPFIIHSAVDLPPALTARFPGLLVQTKPCLAANLIARLGTLVAEDARSDGAAPTVTDETP